MSPLKREQNGVAFLRRKNDGGPEELMAEIERRRWMDRIRPLGLLVRLDRHNQRGGAWDPATKLRRDLSARAHAVWS